MAEQQKKKFKPLPEEVVRHCVWRENGDVPVVMHATWEAAYCAASKLAEANPGERFHVMQTRAIRCLRPSPEISEAALAQSAAA